MKTYTNPEMLVLHFQDDVVRTSTTEDNYDWIDGVLNNDGTFTRVSIEP